VNTVHALFGLFRVFYACFNEQINDENQTIIGYKLYTSEKVAEVADTADGLYL